MIDRRKHNLKIKRTLIRISIIIILIFLGIFLYTIGKEHKVLIDNVDVTVNDTYYISDTNYNVLVNNQEIGLLEKGKRKAAMVVGKNHKIIIQEVKNKELIGEKYEKMFNLKSNENATINLPAMINNADIWIKKTS
jgi:hypothetical protein